jgi:UDP-N-acetylmuramoylalanine--D-glutamate ligase
VRELIHSGQLPGHSCVVVGGGASGRAAARLLTALGASVRLLERGEPSRDLGQEAQEKGWEVVGGEHRPEDFAGADLVVLSPGVPVSGLRPLLGSVPEARIVAEMELGFWFTTEPIIAVTGTNGKTTTASLIHAMLQEGGVASFLGGNIGTPLCDYLISDEQARVLVLEASSFQLQNVKSFRPHVGVLLNVAPNHLDYHADMDEYLEAKLNLFARQKEDDLAVAPLALKEELEGRGFTRARRVYFVPTERFEAPGLPGGHNRANLEAAWLAARAFGVDEESAARAAVGFSPPPHRLQILGTAGGVTFVDDSKATTLEAMAAALSSFSGPVRLLAGGVFKGGDPADLLPLVREKVVQVGLFGGSREIFEQAWAGEVDLFWEPDLGTAARRLLGQAGEGEVLLLSPGTSSFDQYPGYAARGDDFQKVFAEAAA